MKTYTLVLTGILLAGYILTSRVPPSFGSSAEQHTVRSLPRPKHVVIVWEENKAFAQIIGNPRAPFINALARHGALFTHAYGVAHPSEPNYLAFFSGSTHDLHDDDCPYRFQGPTLASALTAAGLSFAVYAEGLPFAGYRGCRSGSYVRKHDPVADWPGLPAAANRPMRDWPKNFSQLPTVAWVIPDLRHDMHSGSIGAADHWLKRRLAAYAQWAQRHDSLLIVAWDEDDYGHRNHIPLIFAGPMVQPGRYATPINHYSVLRTVEAMYGIPHLGESAGAVPVIGVWRTIGR